MSQHLFHAAMCSKQRSWMGNMTSQMKCKHVKLFSSFCLFNTMLNVLATILWKMAKYILKTIQTFGSKIKHWHLMQWCITVTGVKFQPKRKSDLRWTVCGCWSWNILNTSNIWLRDILEPLSLTPKTKVTFWH